MSLFTVILQSAEIEHSYYISQSKLTLAIAHFKKKPYLVWYSIIKLLNNLVYTCRLLHSCIWDEATVLAWKSAYSFSLTESLTVSWLFLYHSACTIRWNMKILSSQTNGRIMLILFFAVLKYDHPNASLYIYIYIYI